MIDGLAGWSIGCGRWGGIPIRLSLFFFLLAPVLMVRLGWETGLVYVSVLLVATLLHELAHAWTAECLGGSAQEILLWPLGGLAKLQWPRSLSGKLVTILAGPVTNLLLCAMLLPVAWSQADWIEWLNPMVLPAMEWTRATWRGDVIRVVFAVNWMLAVINLLPTMPLDGGQALRVWWSQRQGEHAADQGVALVGMALGWIGMLVGLIFDQTWVVAAAGVLLFLNLWMATEAERRAERDDDDAFDRGDALPPAGLDEHDPWWVQWQQRRQAEKERQARAEAELLEQQLDELLAKVHEHGLHGLTKAEQRRLKQASEAMRQRTRKEETP